MIEFASRQSARKATEWLNESRTCYQLAELMPLLRTPLEISIRLDTLAASVAKMQELREWCGAPDVAALVHYITDWRNGDADPREPDAAGDFLGDLRGYMRPVDEAFAEYVENSDDWGYARQGRGGL